MWASRSLDLGDDSVRSVDTSAVEVTTWPWALVSEPKIAVDDPGLAAARSCLWAQGGGLLWAGGEAHRVRDVAAAPGEGDEAVVRALSPRDGVSVERQLERDREPSTIGCRLRVSDPCDSS